MSRLVPRFNGGSTEAMESLFRFVSTANQPGHGFGLTVWPFYRSSMPVMFPSLRHSSSMRKNLMGPAPNMSEKKPLALPVFPSLL